MRRIQRQRMRGWRMPADAVYVGRPSLFGNPWSLRDAVAFDVPAEDRRAWCVRMYRREMEHLGLLSDYGNLGSRKRYDELARLELRTMAAYARHLLRDRDLACWCPLDQPCHADVLLELAA
jgi:hypothetical protein